jgi:hypothetical protein
METMQTNLRRAVEIRSEIGDFKTVLRLKWVEKFTEETADCFQAACYRKDALQTSIKGDLK